MTKQRKKLIVVGVVFLLSCVIAIVILVASRHQERPVLLWGFGESIEPGDPPPLRRIFTIEELPMVIITPDNKETNLYYYRRSQRVLARLGPANRPDQEVWLDCEARTVVLINRQSEIYKTSMKETLSAMDAVYRLSPSWGWGKYFESWEQEIQDHGLRIMERIPLVLADPMEAESIREFMATRGDPADGISTR